MRIHADPDTGQTKSQNLEFLHENKGSKLYRKPGLFVNFGQFPWSWTRNRISITDPNPGQPNQCRSMRIRIHNTAIEFKCI
jgi:hypothetical protein